MAVYNITNGRIPKYHSLQIIPDNKDLLNSHGQYNGRHTWKAWHLIPSSRPVINPPPVKSNFIEIPGGNGSIDASTILTKYPVYADRTGSIEFYVIRDYDEYEYKTWQGVYQEIMNYLHGGLFKVILEDDPAYFYRGRLSVNQWKSEKDWSKIVLDYHFEPYKYELWGSWENVWLWDPFRFRNDTTPRTDITPKYYYDMYQNLDITGEGANEEVARVPFDMGGWTMPLSPEVVIIPKASTDGTIPSTQTPSHIVLKQIRVYSNHEQVVARQVYQYEDILMHTHKPYGIVFSDETGYISIEADDKARFTVSFNFRRGLL